MNAIERLRDLLDKGGYLVDADWAHVTQDLAAVDALYQAAKRVVDSPFRRTPDGTGEALAAAVRRVEGEANG